MRAAVLVWAITFCIAMASIWPAWEWWSAALELTPRGDTLIDRIDLVALKELVQFDRTSAFAMVRGAFVAGAVLALLLNPLFAGGVFTLLMTPQRSRFATQFAEGGVTAVWTVPARAAVSRRDRARVPRPRLSRS